jgi:hypothetical protein
MTAIYKAHQLAGIPNPVEDKLVRTVMAGSRRVKGPCRRERSFMPGTAAEDVRRCSRGSPERGDRALLLIGFAGVLAAVRAGETAARISRERTSAGITDPHSGPIRSAKADDRGPLWLPSGNLPGPSSPDLARTVGGHLRILVSRDRPVRQGSHRQAYL